jgi:hypothetical protein
VLGWRGDWAALRAASSAATEEVSVPRPATACP